MAKLKDKLVKVKRRKVNWLKVLFDLQDQSMTDYCHVLFKKLRHGKSMSLNRCAYNTIRHFYSTTTIDETVRKLGL